MGLAVCGRIRSCHRLKTIAWNRIVFPHIRKPSVRYLARKKQMIPSIKDLIDMSAEDVLEKIMKRKAKLNMPEETRLLQDRNNILSNPKLRVLTYPENVTELRRKSLPVTEFDNSLRELVNDMLAVMYAYQGIGISAPQIGELKRVIAINPEPELGSKTELVLVNPELIMGSKAVDVYEEGCLSFPNDTVDVVWRVRVTVKYSDMSGKEKTERFTGISARIIQHEVDHLNGVLLVDKLKGK